MVFLHLIISYLIGVTTPTITLPEAVRLAWQNSREMKIASLDLEKSDLKVREYWSTFGPGIFGYWNYQRNPEVKVSLAPTIPTDSQQTTLPDSSIVIRPSENMVWGIHLTQKILDPAMIPALKMTYRYRELARLGALKSRDAIARVVTRLYLTLLYLQSQRRMLEEENEVLHKEMKLTEQEIRVGLQPPWSKVRMQLQLREYEKEVLSIDAEIENVRDQLYSLTGKYFDPVTPQLERKFELDFDPEDNLDIEMKRIDLQLARLRKRAMFTRFLPVVSLEWDYSHQQDPGAFGKKDSWYVMLKLSWTLFSGGSRYFQLKESEVDEEIGKLKLDREIDRKRIGYRKLMNEFKKSLALYRVSRQSLALAETNLEMVEEGYKLGKNDVISYLDARANLLRAKSGLLWSQFQVILKRLDLFIELGKVEEFLKEIR